MWITPKLGIRTPSEFEDPFWGSDVYRMTDLDNWIFANQENNTVFLVGDIAFDSVAGEMSWSEALHLSSITQIGIITINPDTLSIADGQFAYVIVPRPFETSTLVVTVGDAQIIDEDVVVIAHRNGDRLYTRGQLVGVESVFGRDGIVVAQEGDYDASLISFPGNSAVLKNIDDLINGIWSATSVSGFGLTEDEASGEIEVASGTAALRLTNDSLAALNGFDIAASGVISIPDETTQYVYLDYNAGSPQIDISTDLLALMRDRTKFVIYMVTRYAGNRLLSIDVRNQNIDFMRDSILKSILNSGITKAEGAALAINGSYNVYLGSGKFFVLNKEIDTGVFNTAGSDSFIAQYSNGSGGWNRDVQTAIDYNHYDNGSGTLQEIPSEKYGCFFLFMQFSNPAQFSIQYGVEEHASEAEAKAQIVPTDRPAENKQYSAGDALYKIITKGDGTIVEIVDLKPTLSGLGAQTPSHNGLPSLNVGDFQHLTEAQKAYALSTPTLAGLGDTDVAGAEDNSALRFNLSSGIWETSAYARKRRTRTEVSVQHYTALETDDVIDYRFDGPGSVTLPDSELAKDGRSFIISDAWRKSASINNIQVLNESGDEVFLINGSGDSVEMQSDTVNWEEQ